jgi:hypothetical protein
VTDGERSVSTTRRTLMRGAAWSVPVVAVAAQAPAFAASPCDQQGYRLDWGVTPYVAPANLTVSPNAGVATVAASAEGTPITVTLTSTLSGLGVTRYTGNLTVLTTTNIGALGAGEQGVAVRTNGTSLTSLSSQTITVTFSRPVSNLSFTIVDIDRDANFNDRVIMSPLPTSYTRAATVDGSGDAGLETANSGPFRQTGSTTNLDDTSGAGNVTVRYAGGTSFTSFQILYFNASSSGPQGILLSDFIFTARGC